MILRIKFQIKALYSVCVLCLSMAVAMPVQAFDWVDIEGYPVRLFDYKGRWVLVNFWATWCGYCLEEMPELTALHVAHYDKDLVVVGLLTDEAPKKKVDAILDKFLINYPIVVATPAILKSLGAEELEVMPFTQLYDPTGKLVETHYGALTKESVEEFLSEHKTTGKSQLKTKTPRRVTK
jgi:thiol-disulfide isomerase/thioredoxin